MHGEALAQRILQPAGADRLEGMALGPDGTREVRTEEGVESHEDTDITYGYEFE